jgi:hypothetical protein
MLFLPRWVGVIAILGTGKPTPAQRRRQADAHAKSVLSFGAILSKKMSKCAGLPQASLFEEWDSVPVAERTVAG